MFKPVIGNNSYLISLNGQIKSTTNRKCTLPIKDGKVSISIYKTPKILDLKWLSLASYFELKLLGEHGKELWNVTFHPVHSKHIRPNSGYRVMFSRPLIVKEKYRIVPGFTHLAISIDGVLLERIDGQWIDITDKYSYSEYVTILTYDPDYSKNRNVMVHRLVALAWVGNNNVLEKNIVNHMDGDKLNYHASNLEWCTTLENNIHAIKKGLRSDNKPCVLRDITTEEIIRFDSIAEACRFLGMDRTNYKTLMGSRVGKLIKNQYEIRLVYDKMPWTNFNDGTVKPSKYLITIIKTDQTQEIFHGTRDVVKKYKLWNLPTYSIECIRDNLIARNPTWKMTWVNQDATGPYQAYRVSDGTIIEHDSIRGLSKLINVPFGVIQRHLHIGETRISKGYAYRVKTNNPWNTNFETHVSNAKCIRLTNPITNIVKEYQSIRAAAAAFNVDKSVVSAKIINGTLLQGYTVEEIKPS